MTLAEADLSHFLLAAGLLLFSAYVVGMLFARWRQPRVIGEILGGLLLGPTVLGAIAPELQGQLIPASGPAATSLGVVYQLGLIWLMFAAGTELRSLPVGKERVTALAVAATGIVIPFALGLALFTTVIQPADLIGTANDETALALVFAAAIAITSIPVISRIMLDLGLLGTGFARIVLGAAVIEDIVLFGLLGVAVGLTQSSADGFGLAAELNVAPGSLGSAVYYLVAVSAALIAAMLLARSRSRPRSPLNRICEEVAPQMLFVFGTVAVLLLLNVPPLFGGLVTGLVVGGGDGPSEATERIKGYGLAFFVPIYFAIVGLRLDLNVFDPLFFLAFFLAACGIKAGSVYVGARVARESRAASRDLAIAMNARGGPGIILASVALDAAIISNSFYTSLVMLAVVSSFLAGWWLERALAPQIARERRRKAAPQRSRLGQPAPDLTPL